MADDVRVPAGWYPDPLGLPQLRWWDNHAWTEYTSDARQPMVAQETVTRQTRLTYAEDETPTRRERRESEALASQTAPDGADATPAAAAALAESLRALEAPSPSSQVHAAEEDLSPAAKFAEFVPAASRTAPEPGLDRRFDSLMDDEATASASTPTASAPEPTGRVGSGFASAFDAPELGSSPAGAFSYDYPSVTGAAAGGATAAAVPPALPRAKNTSTGPVWLIAVFPLLGLFTALVMLASKITDPTGTILGLAGVVVPYVLGIPFAIADWSLLRRRGYEPAHWLWAFATPPAYLIARAVVLIRASGRGFGPLLGTAAFAALTVGVALAVPGIVIGLNPAGYSVSIQQSVKEQAKVLGANIDVYCPTTPPTIVGDQFVCQANALGKNPLTWGITVSLQRSNGWIGWRVDDWGVFMVSNGTRKIPGG